MDLTIDRKRISYIDNDVNLTTLQSQDATVTRTFNNQCTSYVQNNDQICITDRSNSNIFNLSSHDSQSFLHSPHKKKENFGTGQNQWMRQNLQTGKNQQNNVFFNCLSSQSLHHVQNIQYPAYKDQGRHKYQQFALKISKLFNVRFDNLQNLYNQIKQQIQSKSKRKDQHFRQQEDAFQQSDIMKRLFTYAMKIKSGHNQLQKIIQVIDRKKPKLHDQQQQSHNFANKYFNQIQENVSIKVEDIQEKTKRFNAEKTNIKYMNGHNQNSRNYFSQNYLQHQKLDSVQTINTIANTKNQNIDYLRRKQEQNHIQEYKQKSKSNKRNKYSEKLHLIATQLQMIKNQIENQDAEVQNKNQSRVQPKTQFNFINSQFAKHAERMSTISNSKLNADQQQFISNSSLKNNLKKQFNLEQKHFNSSSQKSKKQLLKDNLQQIYPKFESINNIKVDSQAGKPIQKTSNNNDSHNYIHNSNRYQKSYTYINSLEELPEQNDEVDKKIHQAVIKSTRSPTRFNKKQVSKNENKVNLKEQVQFLAKDQSINLKDSEQQVDYSFKKFLQKKQPFTFSKEFRNERTNQRNYDLQNKKLSYNNNIDNVKVNDKRPNQIYLSQQDLPKTQSQNIGFKIQNQFKDNSRLSFKTNSSKHKSSININFKNQQTPIKLIHTENTQNNRVNQSFLSSSQNIQIKQKRRGQQQNRRVLPRNRSGQRLSSIYSVQTIPSVAYIESKKTLQRNSILVQNNAKNIFPGITQSSNLIIFRPRSVQDKRFIQPKLGQNRTFANTFNPASPKLILQPFRQQNNSSRINTFYKDQSNNNIFRKNNNISWNKNEGRLSQTRFDKRNFSLPLRREDNSPNHHAIKNIQIIQQPNHFNPHFSNDRNKQQIKYYQNNEVATNAKINNQKKTQLLQIQQPIESQRNNFSSSLIKRQQNLSTKDLNINLQQAGQLQYNDRHSSVMQLSERNHSVIHSNMNAYPNEETNQKMIQSLNISSRPPPKVYNSTLNIIPQNLKPPRYVPPKNSLEKQLKKDGFQNESKNQQHNNNKKYPPIKTYTQGHLLQAKDNENILRNSQLHDNLKDNANQSKQGQNRMFQSQIQYRHDLMQKSTPSFGFQSSHQFFSKSQSPKYNQLTSSRSKSGKKGISLSNKKKQKMYTSNFS